MEHEREVEVKIISPDFTEDTINRIKNLAGVGKEYVIETTDYDVGVDEKGRTNIIRLRMLSVPQVATVYKIIYKYGTTLDSHKEFEEESSDLSRDQYVYLQGVFDKVLPKMYRTWKVRYSFFVEGLRIDHDKYRGEQANIPEVLEIEGPDYFDIQEFVTEKLGLSEDTMKSWTTKELFTEFGILPERTAKEDLENVLNRPA